MSNAALRIVRFALALAAPLGLTSCDSLFSTPEVPGTPRCVEDDPDCWIDYLYVLDLDGNSIDLEELENGPPRVSDASDRPTASFATEQINLVGPDYGTGIMLSWTDPLGATPAFCLQVCTGTSSTARKIVCSRVAKCTHSLADGFASGVWRSFLGFSAEPLEPRTTEDVSVAFTPISADAGEAIQTLRDAGDVGTWNPDGEDADGDGRLSESERAPAPRGVSVGPPALLRTNIPREGAVPIGPGGGGGSGGGACTQGAACTSGPECISARACIPSVLNESCECSGAATPGSCYPGVVCSGEGQVCGDGTHACCVGLTCTNGRCEGASGRCP